MSETEHQPLVINPYNNNNSYNNVATPQSNYKSQNSIHSRQSNPLVHNHQQSSQVVERKTPSQHSFHNQPPRSTHSQRSQNSFKNNLAQSAQNNLQREVYTPQYNFTPQYYDFPPPEDYNYRTAKRCDTMFLDTVNPADAKYRKFKQINTNRDYSANLFNLDIPGTSPKKFGVLHHKPDFTCRNDDIERSNPKLLHIGLNKPEYNLSNKDIEFSSASTVRIHETRCSKHIKPKEFINPLEPKYKLPKVETIDPPIPKFIRDSIQISDIKGSYPKKYYKWETRRGFTDTGIEGSSPKKPKTRSSNTKYDYINYNDVTQDKFKTKRCVNPLDPVYEVRYKNK